MDGAGLGISNSRRQPGYKQESADAVVFRGSTLLRIRRAPSYCCSPSRFRLNMGSSDAGVYPRHASAPLASTCKSVFLPQSFRSVTPRLWPRGKILLAADSRPRSLHGAHLLLLCLFGRKDTGRDASHSILGSSLTFDRVMAFWPSLEITTAQIFVPS